MSDGHVGPRRGIDDGYGADGEHEQGQKGKKDIVETSTLFDHRENCQIDRISCEEKPNKYIENPHNSFLSKSEILLTYFTLLYKDCQVGEMHFFPIAGPTHSKIVMPGAPRISKGFYCGNMR
jgi:hypothetical protein